MSAAPYGRRLRLLPWTTPEGKPCYLSTDEAEPGPLSRRADELEEALLASGEQVLAGAAAVLADSAAGERAVRFALSRAVESLGDALRVAVSRGGRITGGGE
ncbi:hypothetical protein [Streptomyces sp. NPDC000983]|uniref:hypothetical protein n=1 Tax=Streptomyces sp. NPDC000983 TaxID=3154373 RepID=UPI00332010C2